MPEKLKPAAPLIQINLGIGIGGMNRSVAAGGENTDWSEEVKKQVYRRGSQKTPAFSGEATRSLEPGIKCLQTGIMTDDDQNQLNVLLQFHGVDLSGARFMISERYRRPARSDSAVYARLKSDLIVILSTYDDIIECQIEPTAFGASSIYWNGYYIPELLDYSSQRMAVLVRDNLVTLRYGKL